MWDFWCQGHKTNAGGFSIDSFQTREVSELQLHDIYTIVAQRSALMSKRINTNLSAPYDGESGKLGHIF